MKKLFSILCSCFVVFSVQAQTDSTNLYLIPGQGSDARLYSEIQINGPYRIQHIQYETPEADMNMKEYAALLGKQVDTSKPYSIVGVSLGGMLASEMTDFLDPDQTVIISSAQNRNEIPVRYAIFQKILIYRYVNGEMAKRNVIRFQPIMEPADSAHQEVFVSMISDKDPLFLERTIPMIVHWQRDTFNDDIIHIHGTRDRTLPIRNVTYDYCIEGGTHIMTLTRAEEISELLNEVLITSQ